eukprot:7171683-Prymnesium_polylepis.1
MGYGSGEMPAKVAEGVGLLRGPDGTDAARELSASPGVSGRHRSRQRTLRFAGGVGARRGGFAEGVEVVRGRRSEC